MIEINPMQTYLYNLVCAEAELVPDAPVPVRFNGADTPGRFQCNLVSGELASVSQLLLFSKRSRRDAQAMQVARMYFRNVDSFYQVDGKHGVMHKLLVIKRDNRLVSYGSLSKKEREFLDTYLSMQFDSLCRQRDWFFYGGDKKTDDYRIPLSATELIEMAMGLYAGCKVECLGGTSSRIGFVRFLAHCFQVPFPANYETLCKQLAQRNSPALFFDRIRKSLIAFLRK